MDAPYCHSELLIEPCKKSRSERTPTLSWFIKSTLRFVSNTNSRSTTKQGPETIEESEIATRCSCRHEVPDNTEGRRHLEECEKRRPARSVEKSLIKVCRFLLKKHAAIHTKDTNALCATNVSRPPRLFDEGANRWERRWDDIRCQGLRPNTPVRKPLQSSLSQSSSLLISQWVRRYLLLVSARNVCQKF